MPKTLRTIGAIILFILSGGLTVAKRIADWVGRSTFIEDAESLGPKAAKMFEWLADQPAVMFYVIPLALAVIGIGLLFLPLRRGREDQFIEDETPASSALKTDKSADLYVVDPEAQALDKQAYNQIVAFCVDHLLPACEAQVDLQQAIIRHLCSNEMVQHWAFEGLRSDQSYKTRQFWQNYINLSSGLTDSPGPSIKFEGMLECIHELEREFYKNFCEQGIELGKSAKIDLKHALIREWNRWLDCHQKLVAAYQLIKRDIRFGKLHRLKPNRWGTFDHTSAD